MKYPLAVTAVTKTYPFSRRESRTVLNNVTFTTSPGEVVSIIGVNGAGKTTLLKIIVSVATASSGSVSIMGHDHQSAVARQFLGYMPENPQFYNEISARVFMVAVAGLFNLSPKKALAESERLLALVELDTVADQPIRTFSKGMRQRLGFAQSLIGSPKLLLLDEPLDGLDPLGRRTFKQHIRSLQQVGTTVLLCSHILSDIAEISDRVGILHQGVLSPLEPPSKLTGAHPSLEEAFVHYITTP